MNALQKIIDVHSVGFERRKQWPELFDLDNWKMSLSYQLIKQYCKPTESILEIGCLTGHHLLLLAQDGYDYLCGIDFCKEAIDWAHEHNYTKKVSFQCGIYPNEHYITSHCQFDRIILFDVLEHVLDIGQFLEAVRENVWHGGEVLVLVPLGENYRDVGHINFYPDRDALFNILNYYFRVPICKLVDNGTKIFAQCVWRTE